jgi:hypothetical protein
MVEVAWHALLELSMLFGHLSVAFGLTILVSGCCLVVEVFVFLQLFFQAFRKLYAYIGRCFMPIQTVTIIYSKKMEACCVHHVRNENVTVLIYFVRVAWLVTAASCKSKLCDSIKTVLDFGSINLRFLLCFFRSSFS